MIVRSSTTRRRRGVRPRGGWPRTSCARRSAGPRRTRRRPGAPRGPRHLVAGAGVELNGPHAVLDPRPLLAVLLRQPGLPDVGRFDDVVVDADDLGSSGTGPKYSKTDTVSEMDERFRAELRSSLTGTRHPRRRRSKPCRRVAAGAARRGVGGYPTGRRSTVASWRVAHRDGRVPRGDGEGGRSRPPRAGRAHLVGPTLMAHGTAEQRAVVAGDPHRRDVWCQLFCEPGAGCDLAGLSTRGDARGDVYSSPGRRCGRRAPLRRLGARPGPYGPAGPPSGGSPCWPSRWGRPASRSGHPPDHRRARVHRGVPRRGRGAGRARDRRRERGLVGGRHHPGATSGADRSSGRSRSRHERAVDQLWAACATAGRLADPLVRQRLAQCLDRRRALPAAQRPHAGHALLAASRSGPRPAWSSCSGPRPASASTRRPPTCSARRDQLAGGDWVGGLLTTRANSIMGGTSEIQRTIIGERLLGLPREPRA